MNKKYTNRELMLLAIEVMNNSINEARDDGKVPPKVGAVLLFPDGKIETAFRGELREGDHAEYTLLERKLAHENLENCVLFTTLEPCVKRNLPKVACCRRTTNARIKKVFVGIEDPDPTVSGKGMKHLIAHNAEVLMFDRDLQKRIEKENKAFLNQALERKKQAKKEQENILEKPIANYKTDKLNNKALQLFISQAKLDYTLNTNSFNNYLSDIGILTYNENDNSFAPTGFGLLLFGKEPRAKFNSASVKASITYNKDKIESKSFNDALVLLPKQIEDWLYKVLPLNKNTAQFKRTDDAQFPINVLREAIINAIVHRNYEDDSAKCNIIITDDTITIKSPGKPLDAISLDDLNNFTAPSLSRNPLITYIFNLMKYVEEASFGMDSFKKLNELGFPLPKYTYKKPFLTLVFPRNKTAIKTIVNNDNINKLNNKELELYEFFRVNNEMTKKEFITHTKLAERTAQRYLKRFTDLNLIKTKGTGRNTSYIINNN